MVCDHFVFAESLFEGMGDSFDETPSVDEDQSGFVGSAQFGDAIVDAVKLLVGGNSAQLVVGGLDANIEVAGVAAIENAMGAAIRAVTAAGLL